MAEYIKELKIRYVKTKKKNPFYGDTIHCPNEIYTIFKSMQWEDKEQMISVHLNTHLEINCYEILSIGGVGECMISAREIFKGILLSNSPNFILIHNHPSGDPEPSKADLEVIHKIKQQAELIGLRLIDFVIIGDDGFWSLMQNCRKRY